MKKRTLSLFTVFVLIFVLLTPSAPLPAYAEDSYTATVKYYDDIQITYTLKYPNGGVWDGSGDIPIGGIGGVSDQIYCADPFVHFHSVAETSWPGGVTTDTMAGYTVAAPWAVSAAMAKNADAVRWLVLNGYRGNYLNDDQVSYASVARIQELFTDDGGSGVVDKIIALMATKIAVWKVLAGDNVQIISTSLSADTERQGVLDSLIKCLVDNAEAGTELDEKMTSFTLAIEKQGVVAPQTVDGYYYYGPFSVAARINDPAIPDTKPAIDKVFLTASGPDSDGIVFVSGPEGGALSNGIIYGTGDTAPYLSGDEFTPAGDVVTEQFYIKLPEGRDPANGDRLTIKAMAMAMNVPLLEGTPVTFVYGDQNDVQDWNHVQAYIGAAKEDMSMDLYAEAQMNTGETPLGKLYISKHVEEHSHIDNDKIFRFKLYTVSTDSAISVGGITKATGSAVDLSTHPVRAAHKNGKDNNNEYWFELKNGGMALIENLPAGEDYYYRVEEIDNPNDYKSEKIDINISGVSGETFKGSDTLENSSDWFRIDEEDFAAVTAVNTRMTERAHLYVGKSALAWSQEDGIYDIPTGDLFDFKIEYSEVDGDNIWHPLDLTGIFKSDGGIVTNAATGEFELESTEMAVIELVPDADLHYRVSELWTGAEKVFTQSYALTSIDIESKTIVPIRDGEPRNSGEEPYSTKGFWVESAKEYFLLFTNTNINTYKLEWSKTVAGGGASASDRERFFEFSLFYMDNMFGAPPPFPVRLNGAQVYEGGIPVPINVEGANSEILKLKHGQTAIVSNLTEGHYMLRELSGQGVVTTYIIGSDNETNAENGEVRFMMDSGKSVIFKNTYRSPGGGGGNNPPGNNTPDTEEPNEPGEPNEPAVPNEPDEPGEPQTPDSPPEPSVPGRTLTPNGPGSYLEFGDGDVPLGEWRWDEDTGKWIFNEYPPLRNIPQTGVGGMMLNVFMMSGAFLAILLTVRRVTPGKHWPF